MVGEKSHHNVNSGKRNGEKRAGEESHRSESLIWDIASGKRSILMIAFSL